MEPMTLTYVVKTTTTGAIRYTPDKDSPIGDLYLRKEMFDGETWPQRLIITITPDTKAKAKVKAVSRSMPRGAALHGKRNDRR